MRYSPNSQYLVMERWEPRRIEVVTAATGTVVASFPEAIEPRWVSDRTIIAQHPTGGSDTFLSGEWTLQRIPANRGQLDANGHGAWCVSDLSTTTVHDRNGDVFPVAHAREPRLSARGGMAARDPQTGVLWNGQQLGLCEDSRWSSETLVWWLGGSVWGRTTPDQPTVELTVPGRSCAHPCPLWTGTDLFVGLVLDDGELWVAEWADLMAQNGLGWYVGRSSGSAFDWDMSPREPNSIRICYFDPHGTPVYAEVNLTDDLDSMLLPPDPEPLPDIEWTTYPHGVVDDIWPWIANNATALSPDGKAAWILKSDEANFEGQTCGEHWDHDADYVGHLEDSSTGYRWWATGKKRVNATDWVNLGEPEPWYNLPLERNYFNAGARLWLPRRCVTGYRQEYRTDINWIPSGYVQPNIHMEIRVDVGYARFNGREAFVRGQYIPGGNAEINYYGPTGWVKHTPAGSTT